MSKHTLPMLLGMIDLFAAAVAVYHHDMPRCWYWVSAASITFSTITMKG